MSLYDKDNPDHAALLERRRSRWTPEKEAAFQEQMKRQREGEPPATTYGITADELPY